MKELKNNGGWGLKDEMVIIAILALALIVAVVLINLNLNRGPITEETLSRDETVRRAAVSYVEENYGAINLNDELIIHQQNLVNDGFLTEADLDGCDWLITVNGDSYDVDSECG